MAKKEKLQGRIHYEENWNGWGEHFIFETKWTDEDEWGLDTAFKLLDYNGESGAVMSYQALTKVREWTRLGIDFYFGR